MDFQIVAITDRARCAEGLPARIAALCAAGIDRVVVREKDLSECAYAELLHEIIDAVSPEARKLLTVNTFVDVALAAGITQIQLPFPEFRAHPDFSHEFTSVGVSVHGVAEAREAQHLGADWLVAGHIFATDCKAGLEPRGLDFLREVCDATSIPVFAIGGIDTNNIAAVQKAGAAGACLMSGLMTGGDPAAKIARLRAAVS